MAALLNRARMTTATTGTGTVTLGSAVTGYATFAEASAVNATVYSYCIEDGSDFEIGVGTYTSSGTTFSRDTVTVSKISGTAGTSKISLSGTAEIFITARAADLTGREVLTANRIYYVRTDGSDSNDGLADNSGGAFLTIQKAVDVAKGLDVPAAYTVSVLVRAGTYTAGVNIDGPLVGGGTLAISGDTTTPGNVILNATSDDGFFLTNNARATIRGFKLTTTTSGACLKANLGAYLLYGNIEFGACAASHVDLGTDATGYCAFACAISAGAVSHFHTGAPSTLITNAVTITITGTPAFSSYFAGTAGGYQVLSSLTFSGPATGKRFLAHKNGTIDVGTTSLTFLPGDVDGTTESGGKYVGDVTLADLIGSYGTYTPTLTGVSNVGSTSSQLCRYVRVGDIVTVSGLIQVTPTLTATTTNLRASLPIASNLAASIDLSGPVNTSSGVAGNIIGDSTNDAASITFTSNGTTLINLVFSFSYLVK